MKNTKLQNPSLRKRKGFTLIELIVVIAILAILAAIAIPTFLGTLANARLKTDQASARVIISALNLARAEGDPIAVDGEPTVEELVSNNYLEVAPEPQSGDTDFAIVYAEDGSITVTGGAPTTLYPVPAAS